MAISDKEIEQEILAKGLTAPRITAEHIESLITYETYVVGGDGLYGAAHKEGVVDAPLCFPKELDLLTICILVLKNGFTILGKSAPASPENFNAELGRKIARQDAINQIWPLEGYRLRSELAKVEEIKHVHSIQNDTSHWSKEDKDKFLAVFKERALQKDMDVQTAAQVAIDAVSVPFNNATTS